MYCNNCGQKLENKENLSFCSNCGQRINSVEQKTPEKKTTDGFSIAGFVIALISICSCGILSELGLLFSIIGLSNTNKNKTEGKNLAIVGIVINAIMLILFLFLIFCFFIGIMSSTTEEIITNNIAMIL